MGSRWQTTHGRFGQGRWCGLSITTDDQAALVLFPLDLLETGGNLGWWECHVSRERTRHSRVMGIARGQFGRLSIAANALATLLLLLLVFLCAGGNLSRSGSRDFVLLGLATALLLGLLDNGFGIGGLALALVGAVDSGEGTLLDGAGGGEWRRRGWGSGLLAATLQGRLGGLDRRRGGLLLFLGRGAVVIGVVGLGAGGSRGSLFGLDVFVVGIGAVCGNGCAIGLELGKLLVVDVTRGNVGVLVLLVLGSAIAQTWADWNKHTCLTSSGNWCHLLVPSDEISPLFWSGPSSEWIFSRFSPSHKR